VSDGVVRATSDFGRARFLVTGAGKTDSAFVSAAPQGTLGAYDYGRYALTIVRLNGTRAVRFPQLTLDQLMIPHALSWQADGSKMIATVEWISGGYGIYLFDTLGTYVPVVPRQHRSEFGRPRFSLDGQWLYYHAQTYTATDQVSDIYRVHPDGSGNELLFSSTFVKSGFWRSPSPTSSPQFLFVDGYDVPTNSIMSGRLDLVTRTITRWPVDGFGAVYSPAADLVVIAPTDGRLVVMRPDGTGVRVLTTGLTSGSGTNAAPTWSPDGRWILAVHPALDRYVIVRVSDGATVPLTLGANYGPPAWRP
jgi:Tol biopolymer transport system component